MKRLLFRAKHLPATDNQIQHVFQLLVQVLRTLDSNFVLSPCHRTVPPEYCCVVGVRTTEQADAEMAGGQKGRAFGCLLSRLFLVCVFVSGLPEWHRLVYFYFVIAQVVY